MFDLLTWWFGEVESLQAYTQGWVPEVPLDNHAVAVGRMAGGPMFSVEFSSVTEYPRGERVEIYGSEGTILIDQTLDPPMVHYRGDQDPHGTPVESVPYDIAGWKAESIRGTAADFVEAVRTGREPGVTAAEGMYVASLVERAYRSAAEATPVDGRRRRAELTAVALALGAALGWGTADFLAGRTSRTAPALVVLWISQWIGLGMVLVAALFVGLGDPVGHDLFYAFIAGVGLVVGLGALYRAMAVGAMAIAAPIAATSVVIPVAFGLASGDEPSAVQAAGLIAAIGGVILCSRDPESAGKREGRIAAGVGLALISAVGGGITSTALAEAGSAGVLWVLLVQRATVGALALAVVLGQRERPVPSRNAMRAVIAVGVLDLIATGLYTSATINGELSLVAVVAALYPVVTVMLAFLVLHERIAKHQAIGAFTALAGVAAIAAG